MMNKKLTLKQSICSARIFLNIFGLILEETEELDVNSKLNILDLNNHPVGSLSFDNNNVYISAEYNDTILEASYDIPEMTILCDHEDNDTLFAIWYSNIIFLLKNNNINVTGEFYISNFVDEESEYKNKCRCQPLLRINFQNNSEFTLKILRDGKILGLEISSNDYNERIDITPFPNSSEFIVHDIKKGKYDSEKHSYPYRFYSGIFNAGKTHEKELLVYLEETGYENYIDHIRAYEEKTSDSENDLIQKGLLMQKLDDDMFKKIKMLQEILKVGNIPVFDNLVSACYDSYSDEEIEALLAIKRKSFLYQDGSSDITSSYYDANKTNPFNLSNKQGSFQRKLSAPKNTVND